MTSVSDTDGPSSSRWRNHHWFEDDFAQWRYLDDCGCDLCVMWELETTGLDHPQGFDNEEECWNYRPAED